MLKLINDCFRETSPSPSSNDNTYIYNHDCDFYNHVDNFDDRVLEFYIDMTIENWKVSETQVMAPVPSKCEKCGEDFPSQRAMQAHKAKDHVHKPPGPSLKAKSGAGKSPRTPGSNKVMTKWMKGETRSNAIGQFIVGARTNSSPAASPDRRQDTPVNAVRSPSIRTTTLDESVSLLEGQVVDMASPFISTLRVFPPNLQATPTSSSAVPGLCLKSSPKLNQSPRSPRGLEPGTTTRFPGPRRRGMTAPLQRMSGLGRLTPGTSTASYARCRTHRR